MEGKATVRIQCSADVAITKPQTTDIQTVIAYTGLGSAKQKQTSVTLYPFSFLLFTVHWHLIFLVFSLIISQLIYTQPQSHCQISTSSHSNGYWLIYTKPNHSLTVKYPHLHTATATGLEKSYFNNYQRFTVNAHCL